MRESLGSGIMIRWIGRLFHYADVHFVQKLTDAFHCQSFHFSDTLKYSMIIFQTLSFSCVVYSYADACINMTTTLLRRATQSFRKIFLSLYWKGCVWEGVGDRTELQNIDPTLMAISVSFLFSWAAQPGAWGPASLSAGFLYRILSPTRLIPKWLIGDLRVPSAGWWLSLPHLVTNWSGLQTNWLPVFTELYNSSTSTNFLWASQIALIQPIHGQGYTLLFLDRMHLLFT